jgi:hypothetical protein
MVNFDDGTPTGRTEGTEYIMRKLRRRQVSSLRYYLYISDAKLDMLFEQIDRRLLKHISMELKVDLKLSSVTLHKAEDPAPARTAKLRVVERFIDDHQDVGTCESPGREYFRGQLNMQWGWLARPTSDASSIVFFRGEEGPLLVMLAGSGRSNTFPHRPTIIFQSARQRIEVRQVDAIYASEISEREMRRVKQNGESTRGY